MSSDPHHRPRQPPSPHDPAPAAEQRTPRQGIRPAAAIGIVAVLWLVGLILGITQGVLLSTPGPQTPDTPVTSTTIGEQPVAEK